MFNNAQIFTLRTTYYKKLNIYPFLYMDGEASNVVCVCVYIFSANQKISGECSTKLSAFWFVNYENIRY